MASIYQLNQPTSQFWDFVNGNLEDHPFFAPRGHRGHHGRRGPRGWDTPQQSDNTNRDAQAGETTEPNADMEKDETSASDSDSPDNNHRCDHCGNGKGKYGSRGGPGHHGPGPFRGRGGKGRHGHGPHAGPYGHHGPHSTKEFSQDSETPQAVGELADASKENIETSASDSDSPDNHRHHGHGRGGKFKNKGHGGPGHHGPGPFRGMGGKGRHGHGPHAGPYDFHGYGHRPHAGPYDFHGYGHGPHAGPYEFHGYGHGHHHGAGAFGGPGRGGKGWHGHGYGHGPHAGPYGFPGPHHNGGPFGFGPRGQGHPHKGGRGRHGGPPPPFGGPFDFLRQLGAGLGFPMNAPTAEGVDFTPSVDVFDTPAKYIVHVSLPGAKKSDLSIDYDADESVLHLSGVVYRPGVNEDLHQALVMEERGQHVGVFEREIRLGTRVVPALIIVDGISAKLEDGVLNVTLPKIVQEPEVGKKKVFVEDGALENEKDAMVVDERTLTPVESEGSEVDDGETREYVKVPVQ
ncbi:hypothetical protein DTO027I6_9162 [Penicillium roqueforti]|uniref:uncharacterized protein n=1 Tax=Penicillium roqueforti TaxID=5082 RepID=UPI00190B66F4|nr:uncharacterized protein LCP9604111_5885 [Penicillium roqueforti]KAF9247695.1 hypothetical protein LCP9604111_5885 [Penicillium roqueforti]KAI2686483.1 hypothetical protein LCP963914a_4083 [Penicillium roqueforti]KAI2704531.1 hypothetical protein CBS147372_3000 [Penicillium roqueforti]KAI3115407.1 hypothetical protein CBS147330_9722 [Penicillium roqueforti]KAI3116305.1 hypothetical protein CBS147333_915 [Penicillium roqueforti]